jgi:hypothetical protein
MSEEAQELSVDYGDEQVEAPVEEKAEDPKAEEAEQPEGETEEQKAERHRVEFTEEQQKFINENIVGRQVAKRKEAEQKLEEYQRRIEEYEQRISQQQPDNGEPVVPDPPNIWDDNYEEKIKQRDEALIRHAEWRAEQKTRQEWEQRQYYEKAQQEQQQLLTKVQTYTERAEKEYGIDPSDLQVAGNAVAQFGIPEQLTQYLLDDDAGPAITVHLSRNLAELEQLNQMDPIRAAVYIATEIKPRATRNAKRRSAPPEPTDSPKGSSVPEKERGPKGAVYE